MEAIKFKTFQDLLDYGNDFELINGEIVKRPMARGYHGSVQHHISGKIFPYSHDNDSKGGWWIMTEISVRYNNTECPSHDLAGWRVDRVPDRSNDVTDIPPDWVCEIVSPGHEKKDTFHNFLLLQKYQVPYYWIVWPEDKTIITYILSNKNRYMVDISIQCRTQQDLKKISIIKNNLTNSI